MPHDKNGKVIREGDLVTITCRVKSISMNPDYCNTTVETVEKMYPGEYPTSVTVNARQVELVESSQAAGVAPSGVPSESGCAGSA